MSYRCYISFKQIPANAVYDFLLLIKQEIRHKLQDIAEDNYVFCPTVRYFHTPYSKLKTYAERSCTENWVTQSVSKFRYFYWKEYNLLGVYGVPDCIRDMFDDTIYFQNSVDQDYEFETWDKINVFRDVATKWKNSSEAYVKHAANIDEDDFDVEYHRKSCCYNEIWYTYLYKTLEDDDSVIYFSCFGQYDLVIIQKFIFMCEKLAGLRDEVLDEDV